LVTDILSGNKCIILEKIVEDDRSMLYIFLKKKDKYSLEIHKHKDVTR